MSNSNQQVAHIWAQQGAKTSAKSSNGNFSFEGEILYSYTTPIARFVAGARKGSRIALITSRTYSITTSGKHMPALRYALPGDVHSFYVPFLGSRYSSGGLSADDHAKNLAHYVAEYGETVGKVKRAREFHTWSLQCVEDIAATAVAYAKAFKLRAPKFNVAADVAEITAHHAAKLARNSSPAAIAKRAKAAEYRAKAAEYREAMQVRKAELARLEGAEKLAAWRAGERVSLDYYEARDALGGALLRVKGENLETSMGATVPLAHAIRVFQFAKLCRENGAGDRGAIAWKRNGRSLRVFQFAKLCRENGRSLRVGHFQVDFVRGDGSFAAGCHSINWPEIEAAALAAGVADKAAADTRDGKLAV